MDKRFEKILVCGMLCAALALPFLYNADSYAQINDGLIGPDGIINQYPGIMRLHIIANSDSQEDQELKLAVRNYILSKVQNELDDKEEARTYVLENLQRIEEWAQVAVDAAGFLSPQTWWAVRWPFSQMPQQTVSTFPLVSSLPSI